VYRRNNIGCQCTAGTINIASPYPSAHPELNHRTEKKRKRRRGEEKMFLFKEQEQIFGTKA
jgi:hypothetical protein